MRLFALCLSVTALTASVGAASGFAVSSSASAAQAQASVPTTGGDSNLRALADEIVGGGITRVGAPRAIVAISRHGKRFFFGYSGSGQAPLELDTIVEIGSITKVFTGVLLARSISGGTIDPNASIQSFFPGITLRPCTAKITPVELADFSSGLPELPNDVPQNLSDRGIANYTQRDFLAWLANTAPRTGCDLPAPYLYSNASVGLLGPILTRVNGQPWQAQVAQNITAPLSMIDTSVEPRRPQAQGFSKNGQPAPRWPVFAWYAAGALRSTARDMLAFGEAALGHQIVNGSPVPPTLRQAFHDAMQPVYRKQNGGGVGYSWETLADGSGGTMTYKDGGTAGFNSVIVVDPDKDCAVFVVANMGNAMVPQLGQQLMRAMPQ